jgi:hypothetical protein
MQYRDHSLPHHRSFRWIDFALAAGIAVLLIGSLFRMPVRESSRPVEFVLRVIDANTGQPISAYVHKAYPEPSPFPSSIDHYRIPIGPSGELGFRENWSCRNRRIILDGTGLWLDIMISLDMPQVLVWAEAPGYISSAPVRLADCRNEIRHQVGSSSVTTTFKLRKQNQ